MISRRAAVLRVVDYFVPSDHGDERFAEMLDGHWAPGAGTTCTYLPAAALYYAGAREPRLVIGWGLCQEVWRPSGMGNPTTRRALRVSTSARGRCPTITRSSRASCSSRCSRCTRSRSSGCDVVEEIAPTLERRLDVVIELKLHARRTAV